MPRPNTTQRSWDDYVGDRPIESRKGTDFYKRSERYGPGSTGADSKPEVEEEIPEGYERDPKTGKIRRKPTKSKLNQALNSVRGDGSMLPRGYRMNKKGQVENTAGYVQPDDWYTIDEETGKKRLKNQSERPVYTGQTDYNSFLP